MTRLRASVVLGVLAAAPMAVAAPAPQACEQPGVLPPDGRVGNARVLGAGDDVPVCGRVLHPALHVSWPHHTAGLGPGAVAAIVDPAIETIERVREHYTGLLAGADDPAQWRGRIHIAFVERIDPLALGGFHRFDPRTGNSTLYLNLDPDAASAGTGTPWIDLLPHTIAHEMFHAFQYQLAEAPFERPSAWLIEGLADWAARRTVGDRLPPLADGSFVYHRAMGRLFTTVGDGLLRTSYESHLFWHWLESQAGIEAILAGTTAHLRTGRNADVLAAIGIDALWHRFAIALASPGAATGLIDDPPLPDTWRLESRDEAGVGLRPVRLTIASMAVRRQRVVVAPGDDGSTRLLRITTSSPSVRVSAVGDRGDAVELESEQPRPLCWVLPCDPAALEVTGGALDLVLSNAGPRAADAVITVRRVEAPGSASRSPRSDR